MATRTKRYQWKYECARLSPADAEVWLNRMGSEINAELEVLGQSPAGSYSDDVVLTIRYIIEKEEA